MSGETNMRDMLRAIFSDEVTRREALTILLENGLTQGDVLCVMQEYFGTGKEDVSVDDALEAAERNYTANDRADSNISIDKNAIFAATDGGLWVQGWLYVPNTDLPVEIPLPPDLAGKMWIVNLNPALGEPNTLIREGHGIYTIRKAPSQSEVYDVFQTCRIGEYLVKADNMTSAVETALAVHNQAADAPKAIDVDFGREGYLYYAAK